MAKATRVIAWKVTSPLPLSRVCRSATYSACPKGLLASSMKKMVKVVSGGMLETSTVTVSKRLTAGLPCTIVTTPVALGKTFFRPLGKSGNWMMTLGGCEESTCTVEANWCACIRCCRFFAWNAWLRICCAFELAPMGWAKTVAVSSNPTTRMPIKTVRRVKVICVIVTPSIIFKPGTAHMSGKCQVLYCSIGSIPIYSPVNMCNLTHFLYLFLSNGQFVAQPQTAHSIEIDAKMGNLTHEIISA